MVISSLPTQTSCVRILDEHFDLVICARHKRRPKRSPDVTSRQRLALNYSAANSIVPNEVLVQSGAELKQSNNVQASARRADENHHPGKACTRGLALVATRTQPTYTTRPARNRAKHVYTTDRILLLLVTSFMCV